MSLKTAEKKKILFLLFFGAFLSNFAAEPIRIANLTLLPRDVCGCAHAEMAPLPRNQRCHSQKPVLLPWGCGGLRPGSCTLPLAVHMSLHCLWQSKFNLACLLQNSTGIPVPFERFLWLALRRGPIFGAVGLHAFCLPSLRTLHVCMCVYIYI